MRSVLGDQAVRASVLESIATRIISRYSSGKRKRLNPTIDSGLYGARMPGRWEGWLGYHRLHLLITKQKKRIHQTSDLTVSFVENGYPSLLTDRRDYTEQEWNTRENPPSGP